MAKMSKKNLDRFLDCLVKVVYKDGDKIDVKRGYLIEIFSQFIEIETEKNNFLFHKDQIVKIRSAKEGDS